MKFSQLLLSSSLLFSCCLNNSFAEAIYQWTDPWGHIQYSKTQVPGSMLSDLTKLPQTQKITEQQKQKAMLHKIQEFETIDTLLVQKNAAEAFIQQQNKKNDNHCRKLRNLLSDVRLRNSRVYVDYYYPGHPYYRRRNSGDEILERDLYWQIREHCR